MTCEKGNWILEFLKYIITSLFFKFQLCYLNFRNVREREREKSYKLSNFKNKFEWVLGNA